MKILVGIMYCIENEFDQCIESIKSQTHQNFESFVVKDLPNKLAHNTLYKTFMDRAFEFDLFMKVDADMVLCRNTFFEEVIEVFIKNAEMDNLQISVDDFYTDTFIFGLHIYRNTVTWDVDLSSDNIFVDRIENINKRVNDQKHLAPAAYHSPNPSAFQCYHFGLHKANKIVQPGKGNFDYFSAVYHWFNILKVQEQLQKTNDLRFAYVLKGFIDSLIYRFTSEHANYQNEEIQIIFKNLHITNDDQDKILCQTKNLMLDYLPKRVSFDLFVLLKSSKKYNLKFVLSNIYNKRFLKLIRNFG